VTRQEQDEFAALSQQRATASLESGVWENEITPVTTTDDEGNEVVVTKDDGIRAGTTVEGLSGLKPVFRPDGTVTAGNACPLNDGAAAVVVMSDTRAKALGLTPLARVVSSGVSGLDQPAVLEDLYDWEGSTSRMASQAPWWEPGTASGYHALNFGHLLGEVLRRITGRSLKQFVAEEIAGPLGADFTIGAPESEVSRIAPVVAPPPLPFDLENIDFDSPLARTMTGPLADADAANTSAWRAADIGGANGHGNARSLVRMLSALSLGGTVDGVELLDPATIERTFEVQADGIDLVLGVPFRFGIGFGLTDPGNYPDIPGGRMLHWGGWGGSFIIMDLDRRTTFSYTMNKMAAGIVGSPTGEAYLRAGYAALGVDVPGHVVAL